MIDDLLKQNSGIRLDIGCGANKQNGFVGMDIRPLEGVDIIHNVTMFPWPLPDESVLMAISSHLIEHIPPFAPDPRLAELIMILTEKGILNGEFASTDLTTPLFIGFMNEVWRVLKPGGEFAISLPHGYSSGFLQDPTHCNALNENTWAYFDPEKSDGVLYNIYQPKPWRIKFINWSPAANMEVILVKRSIND